MYNVQISEERLPKLRQVTVYFADSVTCKSAAKAGVFDVRVMSCYRWIHIREISFLKAGFLSTLARLLKHGIFTLQNMKKETFI